MSFEDAAKLCADAAENNLRVAADVAGSSPAATGFPSIDNLIGQALQRSQELLEEGADTVAEAAADFTARIFENETGR
jgi:hypothetical protein